MRERSSDCAPDCSAARTIPHLRRKRLLRHGFAPPLAHSDCPPPYQICWKPNSRSRRFIVGFVSRGKLMDVRPYAIVPFQKASKTYRVKRYRQRAELLREIAGDLVARNAMT